MAVAFLPVFYSKLALNDVPTLIGVEIALWSSAALLRGGSRSLRDRRRGARPRRGDQVHGWGRDPAAPRGDRDARARRPARAGARPRDRRRLRGRRVRRLRPLSLLAFSSFKAGLAPRAPRAQPRPASSG